MPISVLEQVDRFLGLSLVWEPLDEVVYKKSDSTNQIFTADLDAGDYMNLKRSLPLGVQQRLGDVQRLVLRINAARQSAFGASRVVESEILTGLGSASWAPVVIENDLGGGWLLMAYHGSPELMPSELNLNAVLSIVESMQQLSLGPVYSYESLLVKYLDEFNGRGDQQGVDHVRWLDQLWRSLPDVGLCLVHQDLHPENILKLGSQYTLIDWEYSGIGNPWSDGAALIAKFGCSLSEVHRLPRFKGLSESEFESAIKTAEEANHLLEKMWFAARESES
ncbi:phosphotransferase [Litoribacillus peritrichatus]|uniref:Aminoglycoside phosphotransferase domain-containing protein n=1 Tax=Litoribacillus peritrichatus TaxID=718191 RepID=A0ABP7M9Y0_9GAMM